STPVLGHAWAFTHLRRCSTNSYSKVGAQTRRVLLQRIDTAEVSAKKTLEHLEGSVGHLSCHTRRPQGTGPLPGPPPARPPPRFGHPRQHTVADLLQPSHPHPAPLPRPHRPHPPGHRPHHLPRHCLPLHR